jgi:CheY-like chemotaxis protein
MKRRILIIDDEDHIRRVMRMTLEAAGYEVGEAADGPRGLEAFGDGSTWDAVLLDQRMPGMDGLETLRRLKQRQSDTRVIMITAYASIELAVDAMKLGAMDFVRKPMTPEIVRNAVTAALARPTAAPAAPTPLERAPERASPRIARLTLNGFRLWAASGLEEGHPTDPSERRFVVQHPDGMQEAVVVKIDPGMIGFVQGTTGRRLPLEHSFWSWEAEHLLNDYLWTEGKVPPGGRLTIATLGRDDLQVATRWEGD